MVLRTLLFNLQNPSFILLYIFLSVLVLSWRLLKHLCCFHALCTILILHRSPFPVIIFMSIFLTREWAPRPWLLSFLATHTKHRAWHKISTQETIFELKLCDSEWNKEAAIHFISLACFESNYIKDF